MQISIIRISLLLVILSNISLAQDSSRLKLSAFMASVDSSLNRSDSLAVFHFLDSMMRSYPSDTDSKNSTIAARIGYNSNITATGRPFALGNFGLNTGFTYLHHSGFYGDVTGYLSPEYSPSYFLTTATAGYLFTSKAGKSVTAEYSRFIYNLADNSSIAYTGTFSLTGFLNWKKINLRTEYNLYHGTKIGHRFTPTISGNFTRDKLWIFDKIQFWPGAQFLFGMEKIIEYVPYSTDLRIIGERFRRGLPVTIEKFSNKYGLMNTALTIPVNLQKGNWNFMLLYTYNIPVALPGETLDLSPGGFFSFSLTKYLSTR